MADDLLARHRRALVKRFPVYGLFDAVESSALPSDALAALRSDAARVAELAVAHELDGAPAEACARALLAGGADTSTARFAAWRRTLEAADPDRPGMALALGLFGHWLSVAPAAEAPLLAGIAGIAPVLAELKADGVLDVVTVAGSAPDPAALWTAAGAYGSTDGATVLGIIRLGARAQSWDQPALLDRLRVALPPERTDESRDAERFIPALAAFGERAVALGQAHGQAAVALALTLAENHVSSGYSVATDGRRVLDAMDAVTALAYLEDFGRLADTVGARVTGFGLKTLPGLYPKHGAARTRAFVQAAASVAEAYGTTAAQWFYERKTEVARDLLGA